MKNNPVLEKEYEIYFNLCSAKKVLKISALFDLFNRIAIDHAEILGFGFDELKKDHQAFVLSRVTTSIKKLPKWRDKIRMKTWISFFDGTVAHREIEIYLGEEKIISAKNLAVLIDMKTFKATIYLKNNNLEELIYKKSSNLGVEKVIVPEKMNFIREVEAQYSDLDILNHVNNARYLEWILNSMELNKIDNQSIKNIAVNFLSEIKHKQKAAVYYKEIEKVDNYKIECQGKLSFTMAVDWYE